ncbi:heparan-alpha-glucosaminide N-acetyltransferase domain-containing protein [Stomatohabitans albus]|uniref:heparan-alpha-glucosaminide N-acetyltransferase domain-containing protein n=1 Tax=Stomatohabitans albus TaxID=3110766 RepID=UPI00300C1954
MDSQTPESWRPNIQRRVDGLVQQTASFQQNINPYQGFVHQEKPGDWGQASIEGSEKKITKSVDRITGIDIARALSLLGMILAHFVPARESTHVIGVILGTVHGRASLAFVVIAGIGITLLLGAKSPHESIRIVLWRAGVLFMLGILLQEVSPGPIIILQFYAFYYVVGWVGAQLPTWALALTTASWLGIGCSLWWINAPRLVVSSFLDSPVKQLASILYNGQYPLVTWGSAVLAGVLLGRVDWQDRRIVKALACAALVGIVGIHGAAGLTQQVLLARGVGEIPVWATITPHSNTIFYLVEGEASATFLVAFCVLVAPYLGKAGRALATAGRQALTLYICHLLWLYVFSFVEEWIILGVIGDSLLYGENALELYETIAVSLRYVAAFTCFIVLVIQANIWGLFFKFGTFEYLLRPPSGLAHKLIRYGKTHR